MHACLVYDVARQLDHLQHLGSVAIVVVPWIDQLFIELSLTQHFGPQERSNVFGWV